MDPDVMALASTPEALARLKDLLARAAAGDTKTLPEVRKLVENRRVLDEAGHMARRAERAITAGMAGTNLVEREAVARQLDLLRAELSAGWASPLDRLLVERVVVCWLAVYEAEERFATAGELPTRRAEHWQRRIDQCHKRYLGACKALASVRRLALPVVQVNIGERQVNVAGGGA